MPRMHSGAFQHHIAQASQEPSPKPCSSLPSRPQSRIISTASPHSSPMDGDLVQFSKQHVSTALPPCSPTFSLRFRHATVAPNSFRRPLLPGCRCSLAGKSCPVTCGNRKSGQLSPDNANRLKKSSAGMSSDLTYNLAMLQNTGASPGQPLASHWPAIGQHGEQRP